MPTANKTSWAALKVGLLAIAAFIILGILVFLLTGSTRLFASRAAIYTYMGDVSAITKGSPVRLNGILVGKVDEIGLSGEGKPERTIKVKMDIAADMLDDIPVDSLVTLSADSPLGAKFLNIKRGVNGRSVQPNGELRSLPNPSFDEFLASGNNLLVSLQTIVDRVNTIVGLVEAGRGSIGKLLVDEELYNRLNAAVTEVQRLTQTLNTDRGTIGKLIQDPALYNDIRGTVARVDQSLQRVDEIIGGIQAGQGTAGKLLKDEALYADTRATVTGLRRAIDDLNAGKGTAGRLLKDDELANQVSGLLRRLDSTVARINAGEGTIGQLLVNEQLYTSLNSTTQEVQSLLKDFRANPRKFLTIKLELF